MKKDVYNLTNPQRSIWLTEEVYKNTTVNNICTSGTIYGNINEQLLKKAIINVVKQHDSFRIHICLENGIVKQYVSEFKTFNIEIQYINDETRLKEIEEKEAQYKFEILNSNLFKFKIVILKNIFACVILTANHIISDSWSMGLTIQEILRNYHALNRNETINNNSQSYIDYINLENEYKNSLKYKKDKEYWNGIFKSLPEQATIPGSLSVLNTSSITANRENFEIKINTVNKINDFCKKNHFSLFNFFMAIYSLYISRVSNTKDFVIGTPILNRATYKDKHTTGMFVNTVPVRINDLYDKTFKSLVASFSNQSREILRHQKYSYNNILEDIRKNNFNTPNLYNILISYQITKAFNKALGNYTTNWTFNNCSANDIAIHITDINDTGKLIISYDYLTNKYTKLDIQNLHKRINYIIDQVLNNPEILTNEIDIITLKENKEIIYNFNNTNVNYSKEETIITLFEKQVKKTPDKIAVVFENQKLTYKELNTKANSLAFYLRNTEKITRNSLVGIMVNRSLEMIIAILATLKAGGAYIPIDPTYPKDRITYMLEESNVKILLTQDHLKNVVNYKNQLVIDLKNNSLYSNSPNNLVNINKLEDLGYVIFTSGSTGKPKGVMITHKVLLNFTNYCNNYVEYLKHPAFQAIVSITTISFDIFFYETIISLQRGLKVVIANEDEQNTPHLLNNLLYKHNVKIIQSTPSRMQLFTNNIAHIPALKKLTYIILAGEQLPINLVNTLHTIADITIYNGYGPSETYYSTLTKINNDFVTIGKPIYNTQMYILDSFLKPVPVGVQGEIYISGDAVGKGYLNNNDLTAKSFIKNPFIPNNIMYKTGDLGLYMPDGNIICLGRSDNQVKIRGLRIELGEIEDRINELNYINTCAVVKKTNNELGDFLCAYYTSDRKIDKKNIQKSLANFLPKYMIPNYYIHMDALPYTPNGKIDRNNLPEPFIQKTKNNYTPPRNYIDSKLVSILKDLLKVDSINIDDDLFDLGLDSLSAINLCIGIKDEFNAQILVKDIIENSQLQCLSDIISKKINTYEKHFITPVPKADYYEASSAQKRIFYASQVAGNNSILYNLPGGVIFNGHIDIPKLEQCLNTLINRHEALRTYFEVNNTTVKQKIINNIDFKLKIINNANFKNLDTIFKDFVKSFDLSKAPLFRAQFIKFNNGKSALLVDMHHIIADGSSLSILTDELCKLYNNESLHSLDITYKDFTAFEKSNLKTDLLKEAEEYWLKQFEGELPVLNMPTNYIRPAIQSFDGKKIYTTITSNNVKKINKLSKELGITPYILLLSCYYILLSKYTAQDDIIIGSPITGREFLETSNIIGMFVNTLALRNQITSTVSFKDFLLTIKENVLTAYNYQSYPFDELVKKLHVKKDLSRSPIFDTLFTYQNNGYKELIFKNVNSEYYMPDTEISKYDLSIEAIPVNNHITLAFEYATSLFTEEFITILSNHYLNILDCVLDNIDIKISNINMLSKDEQKKILYDFNNTTLLYPKSKTIIDLFEEQVEKNPDNIAIVFESKQLTYKELNEKANSLAHYLAKIGVHKKDIIPVIMNRSDDLIISMLAIVKLGAIYLPISLEMPIDRINYIIKDTNSKLAIINNDFTLSLETKLINIGKINTSTYSIQNLNTYINSSDLLYIIYTSGSTGNPKGVKVCHQNLVNFIYSFKQLYGNITIHDKLLASTNISFDVSIFEIFMPLLNGFTLYLYNEPNINNINSYCKYLVHNDITFAYIPPNILELVYDVLSTYSNISLNKILLGVEPIKSEIVKKYFSINNSLKIVNAYGPTETTICATAVLITNKILNSYINLPIGKPLNNLNIYILDKYLQPVAIDIPGEIYIAGDNVSKGYLNNDLLTQKSFVTIPSINCNYVYKTGDIGKWDNNGLIKFIGRNDNQIKINGHRIELQEIENCICLYPNINKAIVLLDNKKIICYFTSSIKTDIANLKKFIRSKLPSYFMPNFFVQLEKFDITSNGKINKKTLPKPNIQHTKSEITQPRNNIDFKLLKIIKPILNIDEISLDDDFFNLGGDSLSAINLCIQINNEFNIELFVKDILEHPILQDLSDIISEKSNNTAIQILPIKKAKFYNVSSAQKRIYFSSIVAGNNSILYNIPGGVIFDGNVDTVQLEKCISKLIYRHEALRTYFELNNNEVVQKILENYNFTLDIFKDADFNNIDSLFKDFVKPFKLSKAPLFRAKYITFTNGKSALFTDTHHIISDGKSITILIDELCKLYNKKPLSKVNITYKDFSAFEKKLLVSGKMNDAKQFWINQFDGQIPILNMPTIYPRPAIRNYEGKKKYFSINRYYTKRIKEVCKQLNITPYMFLIANYYILLSKYTLQEDIVVGSPILNRNFAQTYSLIGMFVNTLALRNKPQSNISFKEFVSNVKENLLNAYRYQFYPFDELINNLDIKRDTSRNALFDTMFIYQNSALNQLCFNNLKSEYYVPDMNISKFDLTLEAVPMNEKINFSIEYSTSLFDEYFINSISNHYKNIIKNTLENVDVKISNIDMLSKKEKNKILFEYNNTSTYYLKNKTISDLFEEQVEKTPNSCAIVFEDQELTYKELNNKANSLAYYLRNNKKVNRNDLIGIMVNRSLEMIVSILAVLKSGGAYIPIDPSFPQNRINYMLENSNAKLLLTQESLSNKINFDNKVSVDLSKSYIYNLHKNNLKHINTPDDLAYIIFTSGSTGEPKGVMLKHKSLSNLTNYCNKYIEYLKDNSYKTIVSITTISFDIFIFETLISLQKGLKLVIANENEQHTPHLLNALIEKHNVKIMQTTPSRMQMFLDRINDMPSLRNLEYITLAGEQLPSSLVNTLFKLWNPIIYNGYGPSETTVFSTLSRVLTDKITIGKPLYNTQIYILNDSLEPVPINIPGNIYISGEGIGKGYLNRNDLTAKSFIKNPFIPNMLMYKTGDIGMYNRNGEIVCLGRSDSQVKIRGLRIELEEIESTIQKFPNIKKACVVKQTINNREFLSAYFVASKRITTSDLRKHLAKYLPRYMVPSYYIALSDFPYTPNGKIDKKALPLSKEILNVSNENYVAPQNSMQKQIVRIWEKILNTKPIGINDNFFELGGDSLLAMNLHLDLLKLSKKITYQDIFRYPTIAEIDEKINSNNNNTFFNKIENLSDSYIHILKNSKKNKKIFRYHPKNILITGATGFLGIHILEQFLKREKGKIYCIVREEKGITSRTRLHQKLNYYFGNKYDHLIDKRIFALTGDITEPGFGLNQDTLLELANSVDLVINSAANVAHFGNYNDFYNTNVKSIKYIIDFCKSFNIKLYHISTLSVSDTKLDLSYPAIKKDRKVIFDESSLYIGQPLNNFYTRTKFEAETQVLSAINTGLDGYILRMGHLMPRSKDGLFQENILSNDLADKIITFMKLRIVPDYLQDYYVDFTPVDQASKAIYRLITNYNKTNRIFHIFNHNYVSAKRIIKILKKQNYNFKILQENEFKEKIKELLDNDDSKDLLKNLINNFDNDLHLDYETDIIIKSDFTVKYLRKLFFKWWTVSNRYLFKFIKLLRKEL